uniref:Ankyrin repeat and LEM domain containing 1 n=1 Tax=Macrostomum lignano TaxID=282301 RepID=A0A1I8GWY0_9PLAT
ISLQNLSAEFPEIYSRYEAFRCYHREKKRRHPTEPDEVAAAKIACPDVCESEVYTAAITSGLWPHLAVPGSDDSFKQMIEVSRLLSDYLGPDAAQDPASLLASSLRLRNLSLDFCHRNLTQWKLDHPPHRQSVEIRQALKRCARLHEF